MNLVQRMENLKAIQQSLVGEVNKIDAEAKSLSDRRVDLINELLRNDGGLRQLQSLQLEEQQEAAKKLPPVPVSVPEVGTDQLETPEPVVLGTVVEKVN